MENQHLLWVNQQTKWQFSMTMLVYQRVQSGWWLVLTPSEKYDFVKWDYEVLN
jgi:hypothetical protein